MSHTIQASTDLEHRGYVGVIDTVDAEAGLLSGTVPGVRHVFHFEGRTVDELRESFHAVIDLYMETCEEDGVAPEVQNLGGRLVPVDAVLHDRIEAAATARGESLRDWVARNLNEDVERENG